MSVRPLVCAAILVISALGAAEPPLTLDGLYAAPVETAAARVLGPGPEVFVERSPWNGIPQNYVMNTVGVYGLQFFTRPERIAPMVCAVGYGMAALNTVPGKGYVEERLQALKDTPVGQRPLELQKPYRQRRYFIAGPATSAPAVPGGAPLAVSSAALAADSCDNPVSARRLFDSPSDALALEGVARLQRASADARRLDLRFPLTAECEQGPCDARRRLAELEARRLTWVNVVDCRAMKLTGDRCLSMDVDDPKDSHGYWSLNLAIDMAGGVTRGRLVWVMPPVI